MSSIDALLEAAEYLERRDREAEHGYASTRPVLTVQNDLGTDSRRPKTKKFSGTNRSTHNELEKNRRAHLRGCMESLKNLVPLGQNSARHTTLGLLIKAKNFIKNLEFQDRKYTVQKETLRREARHLRRKLESLQNANSTVILINESPLTKRRSVSECSALSSSSSTASSSSSTSYSHSSYLSVSSGNSSSLSELEDIEVRGSSEDELSVEGEIFDWSEWPKPRGPANGRVSVSSCQITLSEMDI